MVAFLYALVALLEAAGVGVFGQTIFIGAKSVMPDGPGPWLTIIPYPGLEPTRTQNAQGAATRRPLAQVLARAETQLAAYAMGDAAFVALNGHYNETVQNVFYLSIEARQEPGDLGQLDAKGRAQVAFNIAAEMQP
jgi:hypothetical protein